MDVDKAIGTLTVTMVIYLKMCISRTKKGTILQRGTAWHRGSWIMHLIMICNCDPCIIEFHKIYYTITNFITFS